MNVPRYWRKNSQRYRLVGVQYEDGQKSVVNRPQAPKPSVEANTTEEEQSVEHVTAA